MNKYMQQDIGLYLERELNYIYIHRRSQVSVSGGFKISKL